MAHQLKFKGLCQFFILILMTYIASGQSPQCPNTLAIYNPDLVTSCMNGTFFIVPVDTVLVQSVVAPYNLVPLPTSDKTLFPNGFPAGKFPVVVTIDIDENIRLSALQIPKPVLSGSITVPYVDRLGDGKTGFVFSVRQYISGYEGDEVSSYANAIVATLGGINDLVASFVPNNAPYQEISTSPPEYTAQITDVVVPLSLEGAGGLKKAVDTDFLTVLESDFTDHTFHEFISQPLILTNGLCQRIPLYFNQTFSDSVFLNGTVILYEPGGAFQGVYDGVQGYSASGETVMYNAESCSSAAANTDPKALA